MALLSAARLGALPHRRRLAHSFSLSSPDQISLDTVLWAVANLYVHMTSAIRLILDERRVVLTEEEEEGKRILEEVLFR